MSSVGVKKMSGIGIGKKKNNRTSSATPPSRSLLSDSIRRLKKNRGALYSGYFILVVCIISIFAEWISPYPFDLQNVDEIFAPPSSKYWLGTDNLGRDLLSRIIHGAQVSMAVGIFTALVSSIMGTVYGAISGWFGGWVDSLMMRFVDLLFAIPALVLLILVMVIFNSYDLVEHPKLKALTSIFLALSVVGWVNIARLVRGQVLQTKELLYIESAKAIGVPSKVILFKHVLPNILGPIIVTLTFLIPANILFESFLSFIGLGLQPPYSSWGVLANEGWRSLRTYPHLMIGPGIALYLTMLAFNLFGDGLRDALDPKMKNR